jgi:hypothetical protein
LFDVGPACAATAATAAANVFCLGSCLPASKLGTWF